MYRANVMKKLLALLLLFGIVGCAPDEEILDEEAMLKESVKKSIDNVCSQLKSIPANKPCEILTGYKALQEVEENWSTAYYSNLSKDGILKYESLCDLRLKTLREEERKADAQKKILEEEKIKAEVEKKRLEELNSIGDWEKGNYVDEFGDKTNKGFVGQSVMGSFSNSATEGSALRVKIFINDGDLKFENPWFRFYEYAGRNPVKGTFSTNTMSCKIKDKNDQIFRFSLDQSQGADHMYMSNVGKWNKRSISRLEEIILEGDSASFACVGDEYNTSKYVFRMNFKYFDNVVKQLKEQ